tara:strand:- start:13935 stop:14510 length:576 start_codon:yes stop_codon:yes gene_type:complete
MNISNFSFKPLSPKTWNDFTELFGEKGAWGGCWCMWWKQTQKEFDEKKGVKNKQLIKEEIDLGKCPGILAYSEGQPVGWCAVEPRENYPRLSRSRVLKQVDDKRVWSISCFYVLKEFRNNGITEQLIEAVKDFVMENKGKLIEGYPVEPRTKKVSSTSFIWTGFATTFRKTGFTECVRRSETRPIMRYNIK